MKLSITFGKFSFSLDIKKSVVLTILMLWC
jgi:hypothetical protein